MDELVQHLERERPNKKSAEEKRQDEKIFMKIIQNMMSNQSNHQKFLTLAKSFQHAKSNEERMQVSAKFYALLGGKDNYIEQRFNEVKDRENFKDKEMSSKLRTEGNAAYQKGDNMKALELYTKSVAYAPLDSPELALAFANRSAVLRTLGMCHDCLEDIQRALNNGYPKDKCFKLLLREAQCYNDLGCAERNSMNMYLKASINLHSLPKEELSALLKQLEEVSEAPMKDIYVELAVFPEEAPKLSYGRNSEAPCASSAVKIEYSEQQGRHLVATRDIKMGDVLIVEENIVVTLEDAYKYSHCSHCHKLCRALMPCHNCVWVMFCSKECQVEANKKYHKAECAALSRFCHINVKLLRDEIYERVIRTIAMIGISNLKPYLKYARMNLKQEAKKMSNEAKRTKGFNSKGKFDSSDFNTLFNMISLIELQDGQAMLPPSVGTLQIPRCFGVSMENPDFFAIAGLCIQLEDSAFLTGLAKTYKYIKSPKNVNMVAPGHSCNPLASLVNHSCVGNIRPVAYGNKKAVVAMWPIPKGTILTETYFHSSEKKSKKFRQAVLKQRYLFDCKCEACKEDWPVEGKMGLITDPADQSLANVLARENIYGKLEETCPNHLSLIIDELLQKRFDFLTRVWKKKQFLDMYCAHIQQQIQILYSYKGNRVMCSCVNMAEKKEHDHHGHGHDHHHHHSH